MNEKFESSNRNSNRNDQISIATIISKGNEAVAFFLAGEAKKFSKAQYLNLLIISALLS
jgi:hypothetical protein